MRYKESDGEGEDDDEDIFGTICLHGEIKILNNSLRGKVNFPICHLILYLTCRCTELARKYRILRPVLLECVESHQAQQ